MIVLVLLYELHRFLVAALGFFFLFLELLSLFFADLKNVEGAFDDGFPEEVAKDYD